MSHELRVRTHNLKLQARRSKLVANARQLKMKASLPASN